MLQAKQKQLNTVYTLCGYVCILEEGWWWCCVVVLCVIDVGDIAFICPSMHMNRRAIRLAQTLAEKPRKANLLFPALGDGTVELGSPAPSAKKNIEN